MIRIAGILTGAALAIAVLIVTFGIPQFVSDHDGTNTEPIILPLNRDAATQTAANVPVQETLSPAVTAEEQQPAAESAGVAEQATAASNATVAGDDPEDGANTGEEDARHWYAFWSPFRSQLAADGFVTQLQRVTGLDYRVVRIRNGVFEVAFAYADDDEIQANLSRISAATGLELPEG